MYTNKNIRGASLTSPLFLLERKYALNSFNTKRKGVAVTIVETGEKFNSIKACADYIGGNPAYISRVVNREPGFNTCKGYHIVKEGADPVIKETPQIMIVETGESFNTIRECAEAIHGSSSVVCDILNGKRNRKTHKGWIIWDQDSKLHNRVNTYEIAVCYENQV